MSRGTLSSWQAKSMLSLVVYSRVVDIDNRDPQRHMMVIRVVRNWVCIPAGGGSDFPCLSSRSEAVQQYTTVAFGLVPPGVENTSGEKSHVQFLALLLVIGFPRFHSSCSIGLGSSAVAVHGLVGWKPIYTSKNALCRALSQKLSATMSRRASWTRSVTGVWLCGSYFLPPEV